MPKQINFNPWNYLVGKVFIWFWIVIFAVIAVTTAVVHQFDPAPEFFPIHTHHLQHLNRVAVNLKTSNNWLNAPQEAFKQPYYKHQRPFLVVPKGKQEIYSNIRLPRMLISKHVFALTNSTSPQNIHIGDIRLNGPLNIIKNGQEYQVFLIFIPRDRTPSSRIRDLPLWIRVLVPLVLSALLSYLLARSLTKPILKLRETTQQLAQGNLDSRCTAVSSRQDELGKLGQDFDNMAEKISALVAAQQRLLGDVSHELRSPLARLKLATGMLQDADTDNRDKLLVQIERESDRLDEMLGDVLRLSRLESQLALPEPQSIELNQFLHTLIDGVRIEAEAAEKALKYTAIAETFIRGNSTLLASAIENVLRNAIKYTENQSTILVSLQVNSAKGWVNIVVEDFGPGIAEENLEKVFEPFYRESNSRTRQTGGTGLGLAISQRAIMQHGGKIRADNATEHSGLIVTIQLPLLLV